MTFSYIRETEFASYDVAFVTSGIHTSHLVLYVVMKTERKKAPVPQWSSERCDMEEITTLWTKQEEPRVLLCRKNMEPDMYKQNWIITAEMPKRRKSRRKKGCSAILPKHFWDRHSWCQPCTQEPPNKAAAPHRTTHCLNLNIYLPYTDSSYC